MSIVGAHGFEEVWRMGTYLNPGKRRFQMAVDSEIINDAGVSELLLGGFDDASDLLWRV